ncbi:hypothetical protein AVEN_195100-1 [Araneus ventricosus]|uniref:Mos1 transposase HTH domain-containing protein n=1 Tax=Araneus ventricosus TaxID=182803 RepID=A0A4Y2BJ65_ARAVE|nr:hypothetical protein AVEN_195100-1 [Araneus ventricosus]
MKEMYGEQCIARCTIFLWCRRYEAGRLNIKDFPRPGQAHVVINSATISAVDELIRQNRRITTREIAVELSISTGTVRHIIQKRLGYGKICAQWVPKHLSENQKTARMGVCRPSSFCTEAIHSLPTRWRSIAKYGYCANKIQKSESKSFPTLWDQCVNDDYL